MGFNRFRWIISLRVLLLLITILIIVYVILESNIPFVAAFLMLLLIYQSISLIRYVESINRDLKRFLDSIQFSDFSITFKNANLGPTFKGLKDAFSRVSSEFIKARSEKEESFLYFRTLVEHVPTGLISFKADGEIELINKAALSILSTTTLRNLNNLDKSYKQLASILYSIKAGERALFKLNNNGQEMHLAITATQFILRQHKFTLVALQNIQSEVERERISREMEIGQEVQEQLLPGYMADIPGYEISTGYAPAMEVGGDYYDLIEIDDDNIGIVIGDVSGKGLPAAIYMTFTKGIIQANAMRGLSPAETLSRANRLIYRNIARESFITMIYAILNVREKTITFTRAGHCPLIYANNKKTVSISQSGIALGLSDKQVFDKELKENVLQLHSDDTLVFYTDGFNEAMNSSHQEYGTERLMQQIEKTKNLNASQILSEAEQAVKNFCAEAKQNDDRTMIVIKVK